MRLHLSPVRRLQHVLQEQREPLLHPADPEVFRLGRYDLPPDGHGRRRPPFLQSRWGAGMNGFTFSNHTDDIICM